MELSHRTGVAGVLAGESGFLLAPASCHSNSCQSVLALLCACSPSCRPVQSSEVSIQGHELSSRFFPLACLLACLLCSCYAADWKALSLLYPGVGTVQSAGQLSWRLSTLKGEGGMVMVKSPDSQGAGVYAGSAHMQTVSLPWNSNSRSGTDSA